MKGRIYDGCEIKTCYIEEDLYLSHFFPDYKTEGGDQIATKEDPEAVKTGPSTAKPDV